MAIAKAVSPFTSTSPSFSLPLLRSRTSSALTSLPYTCIRLKPPSYTKILSLLLHHLLRTHTLVLSSAAYEMFAASNSINNMNVLITLLFRLGFLNKHHLIARHEFLTFEFLFPCNGPECNITNYR